VIIEGNFFDGFYHHFVLLNPLHPSAPRKQHHLFETETMRPAAPEKPKVGGVFGGLSPGTRKCLFYLICIWVRLALAIGVIVVGMLGLPWVLLWTGMILIAIAGNNMRAHVSVNAKQVWWSRKAHALISFIAGILALMSGALVTFYDQKSYVGKMVGIGAGGVLIIDVLWGVAWSCKENPFRADYYDQLALKVDVETGQRAPKG
jgi:hypothetical protein